MKNRLYIFVAFVSLSLFTASTSKAAFPVKKDAPKTEVAATPPAQPVELAMASTLTSELPASASEIKSAKKHSFFSRTVNKIVNKIKKAEEAAISQGLYIVLAIFWLGWLAMGINDDFEGADWLISLLLYILFYFPGLIYTLIMMGNYY